MIKEAIIKLSKKENLTYTEAEEVMNEIMEGKASELSEGDTEFLGAARRGDKNSKKQDAPKGDKALPRRFAFKQSYMSYLVREYIVPEKDFAQTIYPKKKRSEIKNA